MRIKILLILLLMGTMFASSTVKTLSNYSTDSNFGLDIVVDTSKIHKQTKMYQVQDQKETLVQETESQTDN